MASGTAGTAGPFRVAFASRRAVLGRRLAAGWLAACALLAGGCLATQQEIEDLRVDIVKLQGTLAKVQSSQSSYQTSLQGSQADLLSQMSTLSRNLEILSTHLEESEDRMTQLSTRLDDLDKNLSNRLDLLAESMSRAKTAPPPSPSALFSQAYGDFTRRRYDVALEGFRTYLEKYRDTEKAAQAQYYIGECHASKEQWEKALEAYDAVLTGYPKNRMVPTAYLQKGATLEKLGKVSEALAVYDAIVRKYPHRKEAQAAQSRMTALKNARRER
jgi:tol-pal system protein YbgF